MAGDRLSDLSDNLLRRVLHFAPSKEAVSTGALSRRFRSLWRASAAVNLEARVPRGVERYRDSNRGEEDARFVSLRRGFLSAARAALAADGVLVTRLTFCVEACWDNVVREFLDREETGVVAAVLSHPAARRVQELRLAAVESGGFTRDYEPHPPSDRMTPCLLSLGSLPWETLCALDLAGCRLGEVDTPTPAFPRLPLASLRLCGCIGTRELLQALVDAAPGLAAVRLESAILYSEEEIKHCYDRAPPRQEEIVARLRLPSATDLVLELCCWRLLADSRAGVAVEIDGPRLRRFKYKGVLRRISLTPPAPGLARADLRFVSDCDPNKDPLRERAILWKLLYEFRHVKELKLAVHHLEDIAIVSAAERAELLCKNGFCNLASLELEGVHGPNGKTAAVAIANLLRCCPVLRDLRINLNTVKGESSKRPQHVREFLQRKSQDDLNESMDHFVRSRLVRIVSLQGGGNGDNDKDDDGEVSDIPALSRRSFPCLQSSLRSVGLQFRPEKSNCFGMKLIKFFTGNAIAMEELRIDAGNWRMHEHMNSKVERWITKSSRKSSTSLVVLPLKSF